MKINSSIMLLVFSVAVSCTASAPAVEDSRAEIKEMVKNNSATLIDVRIPEQFNENSIPNAVNIPLADLASHLDFLKSQKEVVVFCNKGIQAKQAVEFLRKNGVENVHDGKTLDNIKAIKNEK
ncbi:rhodanese-like domain-containing protein [Chryseobacterium sp.]|uniref:rhodanese-like domain-containing protein n=1 Tax=Chryseobacterium sp. TaxID=1871047 RepID=UPI0011C9D2E4|nr:rhodanese-like domain-containing protein [Chryseobacterium sp.]TXF75908.1 rhodanese-like domain-containing protein [Chryseobacterium sp.]